jgi:large subunit ribosomal protein L3
LDGIGALALAGTIKRWGHKRGFMTHGSKSHREHGSIGAATTPGRVFPGLKMAGQMGNERVTQRKQRVLKVDAERGAVIIKGNVPGKAGSVVELHVAKVVGVNC